MRENNPKQDAPSFASADVFPVEFIKTPCSCSWIIAWVSCFGSPAAKSARRVAGTKQFDRLIRIYFSPAHPARPYQRRNFCQAGAGSRAITSEANVPSQWSLCKFKCDRASRRAIMRARNFFTEANQFIYRVPDVRCSLEYDGTNIKIVLQRINSHRKRIREESRAENCLPTMFPQIFADDKNATRSRTAHFQSDVSLFVDILDVNHPQNYFNSLKLNFLLFCRTKMQCL